MDMHTIEWYGMCYVYMHIKYMHVQRCWIHCHITFASEVQITTVMSQANVGLHRSCNVWHLYCVSQEYRFSPMVLEDLWRRAPWLSRMESPVQSREVIGGHGGGAGGGSIFDIAPDAVLPNRFIEHSRTFVCSESRCRITSHESNY